MEGPFYVGDKQIPYVIEGEEQPTLVRIKFKNEAGTEYTYETTRDATTYLTLDPPEIRWVATTVHFYGLRGWWDRYDLLFGAADGDTPSKALWTQVEVFGPSFTNPYGA